MRASYLRSGQLSDGLQHVLSLTVWQAMWLSPLAFAIHALEDAPHLAGWMNSVSVFDHVTQQQVMTAVIVFVILAVLATYLAVALRKRFALYWFLWMQGFLFLHGVAHVLPSAWLLRYIPGLWTGLLVDIPVAGYLLHRARRERLVSRRAFATICLLAVLLYDPFLRFAFQIGAPRSHESSPPQPESLRVYVSEPHSHSNQKPGINLGSLSGICVDATNATTL
ncbi:MAG TPA: HXXEE domain-containing protein [Terriglobales bacterium]|nr:HXXEE domain-containing protein [Terriglobales bacterium]